MHITETWVVVSLYKRQIFLLRYIWLCGRISYSIQTTALLCTLIAFYLHNVAVRILHGQALPLLIMNE